LHEPHRKNERIGAHFLQKNGPLNLLLLEKMEQPSGSARPVLCVLQLLPSTQNAERQNSGDGSWDCQPRMDRAGIAGNRSSRVDRKPDIIRTWIPICQIPLGGWPTTSKRRWRKSYLNSWRNQKPPKRTISFTTLIFLCERFGLLPLPMLLNGVGQLIEALQQRS